MKKKYPVINKNSFIHETAVIMGNVKIGKNCGIFPYTVIRGDQNEISIDDNSNVQDCCVLHTDSSHSIEIGKNVSIGHLAMVHGAKIEDNCIIGIHSTILNGAVIRKGSIIGANALVTSNTIVPNNSLVLGIPGKVVKNDIAYEQKAIHNAKTYQIIIKKHLDGEFIYYSNKLD